MNGHKKQEVSYGCDVECGGRANATTPLWVEKTNMPRTPNKPPSKAVSPLCSATALHMKLKVEGCPYDCGGQCGSLRPLRLCGSKGFTVLEMLVVLVIIGILAALLLPSLVRARRQARQTQCMSNLHQLYLAHQGYLNDYPDGLVTLGLGDVHMGGHPEELFDDRPDFVGDWTGLWMGQLEPYLKNKKVYECPMADKRYVNTFNGQTIGYALDMTLYLTKRKLKKREKPKLENKHANYALFADCSFYKTSCLGGDLLVMGFANASWHWISHLKYCPTDDDKRHAGGSNIVFYDGHAETLDFQAIWARLNFFHFKRLPNGYRFR